MKFKMQSKSVFVAVEKSTNVFLIIAENKEQARRILVNHPDIDSGLFEIVEPTLILSSQVIQNQLLDADPWKSMGQGMEYAEAHPSNY
ncbi:MAG: hypothetical protein JO235_26400 [Chroococcidiopsidaceae cyanobacterium CP_BM_RX_35]|nr:hypothetical protein [Chroococcidiopsidaceae cyanobacterium CP_BM_RX_35]